MPGWFSPPACRASARNRSRVTSSWEYSGRSSFTATGRPRASSTACHTSPIPPAAMSSRRWYRPVRSVVGCMADPSTRRTAAHATPVAPGPRSGHAGDGVAERSRPPGFTRPGYCEARPSPTSSSRGAGDVRAQRSMRPVDPRLLRHAAAARGYLVLTVLLGLATTALILAQAGLLARALAAPATGIGVAALAGTLGVLLAVLAGRAVAAYGGELAALRAAAAVKSQLRRKLTAHVVRLGPAWLGGQQTGELATLSTKGLDALDPYFARFLPQLVLAVAVPVAVLIRVALADWISALIIAVTLPLIPVFTVLVGLQTRARTQRQWRLLARLGGHFLDVVEG